MSFSLLVYTLGERWGRPFCNGCGGGIVLGTKGCGVIGSFHVFFFFFSFPSEGFVWCSKWVFVYVHGRGIVISGAPQFILNLSMLFFHACLVSLGFDSMYFSRDWCILRYYGNGKWSGCSRPKEKG
jgi:hypothetical protein